MYATNRLLGFESLFPSFFGAQSPQVPVKPSPEVQTLLDAAAKLPKADQLAGYEKALDAAITAKDPAGARFAIREIRNVLIATKRTNEVEPYLLGLQKRAQQAKFPLMEAHVLVNLALTYDAAKQIDKTIIAYEAATKLFEAGGDKAGQSRALSNMASALSESGKSNEARMAFEHALPLAKESGDQSQVASILTSMAKFHKDDGNIETALSMHEEALSIRIASDEELLSAQSKSYIADILVSKGLISKGRSLLQDSVSTFRRLNNVSSIVTCLNMLADLEMDSGDINQAKSYAVESHEVAIKLQNRLKIASCLGRLGQIYGKMNDLDLALEKTSEALAIYRQNNSDAGTSVALIEIANIHQHRHLYTAALDLYAEALFIARKRNDYHQNALILLNMAMVKLKVSDYIDCVRLLDEAESISNTRKLYDLLAECHGTRGNLYITLGEISTGLSHLRVSEQLHQKLGKEIRRSFILCDIGDQQLLQGTPLVAIDSYNMALDIRRQAKLPDGDVLYPLGEAQVIAGDIRRGVDILELSLTDAQQSGTSNVRALCALAKVCSSQGRIAIVPEVLQFALSSSFLGRSPDDIAKVYSALADHALAMKDRDVAIIHLKRAIEARQVQRRGSIGLDDAMTASLSLKVAPDYRKLAGLLTDSGRLGEAMEVAELLNRSEAKVRGGDIASETSVDQGKVSTAEAAYRKAAEDLGKLGDRERFLSKVKYPSDSVKAEIAAMPAKLKVANKALTDALNLVVSEEKAAGSAAGRLRDTGAAQARLAATLKRLGPGYAAVTVLCLPDSIRFLISTPTSLTMKRVTVAEKSLVGQVKVLRDALLDPTSDPIPSAKALHTVLWAPIESEVKRLGVKHVLLSLTGTARYVPFGALHNGIQYVAQSWGLSLYSPTVLEHIGDRTAKQWSVLAAGNSTERTVDDGIGSKLRFTSLPGVRAELARVRQSVGAGPAPILDNEFTLATLKDGLGKQPNVVHLASHFQFDPRAESLSFLLTGQGEVLRASDTTVLTKDAFKGVDLLTLSACQTGTFSETADGMEVEGIASLMQRKGAGAVMSTLWPVADASTAAFMGTFYSLRAQDPRRTKAWCLREAQLRMIRGEVTPPGAPKPVATRGTTSIKVSTKGLRKDWSHPYHWAPFILQGNPL